MKYKVGDKVRIKSLDWYNENKDKVGDITFSGESDFIKNMSVHCGKEAVIIDIADMSSGEYYINIDKGEFRWIDEMFEDGLGKSASEMEQKKTFEPFERIIVKEKNNKHSVWSCDMVSLSTDDVLYTFCRGEVELRHYDILPFAGNETLVGTSDMPEEEIELKKGELVVVADTIEYISKGLGNIREFKELDSDFVRTSSSQCYSFCIPLSKFNYNDMTETCKHILTVKNEKLVKARV